MDFTQHPCFNSEVRRGAGRVHLPVAEKCNLQCNFCNRKYDCSNESRPGLSSVLLRPRQALLYLDGAMEKLEERGTPLRVAGIAGPGDPFANPEAVIETLELIREKYPDLILCLSTNGLGLPDYIDKVAALAVSHVTVTVNAIDPEIGAKIYPWVRIGPKGYRGLDAARILLQRQTEAIGGLKKKGITVKVNTVIIPGVNDIHAPDVAAYAANLGADIQNNMPMVPVAGTAFEHIPAPSPEHIAAIRRFASRFIPQMSHCARCRADAAGLIGCPNSGDLDRLLAEAGQSPWAAGPSGENQSGRERPYVAAASMEGLFVNRHLGEAAGLYIYGLKDGKVSLVEQRRTPAPGSGDERWKALAGILHDCRALLAGACGPNPRRVLDEQGLRVVIAEGLITDAALPILNGQELPKIYAKARPGPGAGCMGTGTGCGA
ncbi:MAG: radical SAM protein [Treponema sp.]|nr:radical SAM protein [Treponema sp.]